MKENELSEVERLDLMLASHKFYNRQIQDLEMKIATNIDKIFDSDEEDIPRPIVMTTLAMVKVLLTLSRKYIKETSDTVEQLDKLPPDVSIPDKEKYIKDMKIQLLALQRKQNKIHSHVEVIQTQLKELYDIEGGDEE